MYLGSFCDGVCLKSVSSLIFEKVYRTEQERKESGWETVMANRKLSRYEGMGLGMEMKW